VHSQKEVHVGIRLHPLNAPLFDCAPIIATPMKLWW
jgi:hypothetical protein